MRPAAPPFPAGASVIKPRPVVQGRLLKFCAPSSLNADLLAAPCGPGLGPLNLLSPSWRCPRGHVRLLQAALTVRSSRRCLDLPAQRPPCCNLAVTQSSQSSTVHPLRSPGRGQARGSAVSDPPPCNLQLLPHQGGDSHRMELLSGQRNLIPSPPEPPLDQRALGPRAVFFLNSSDYLLELNWIIISYLIDFRNKLEASRQTRTGPAPFTCEEMCLGPGSELAVEVPARLGFS